MSTNYNSFRWLGAAIVVGILAGGIPYWPIPYNDINMTESSLLVQWSLSVGAAALMISALSPLGPFKSAVITGIGLPLAVFVRVITDGFADPTSHNLWPLELVIACVVAILPALIGSYVGFAARTSFRKKS